MEIPDYKAKSSVRLALMGDGDRRSSVWSLFTAKKTPDVYVVPRVLGGQVKISLHASGSWQVGFTAESDRSWWDGDNRHWEIWPRPAPMAHGLTRAYYVVIPDRELRVLPRDPKTKLLPPVGDGFAVSIEVLLVPPLGPELVFDDATVLARMRLGGSDESVLVVARRIPWGEGPTTQSEIWREAALVQASAATNSTWTGRERFVFHGHDADGVRFGVELAAPRRSCSPKAGLVCGPRPGIG